MTFWAFAAAYPVVAISIVVIVATDTLAVTLIITECIRHSCLALAESKRHHD